MKITLQASIIWSFRVAGDGKGMADNEQQSF
jgi:hypothetical protein